MDYKTLGQNIRRLRVTQGFRQEDLAEKCECSASHIGQIENGRVKPSLEMTVRIANALNATTDQLLAHEFSHPEEIYLKKISERIEKYPVSKRILACEGFNTFRIGDVAVKVNYKPDGPSFQQNFEDLLRTAER